MKIVVCRVGEMRIRKSGMSVVPGGLNVFVESGDVVAHFDPLAGVCSCIAVIKIVIDGRGRLSLVDLGFVHGDQASRAGVHDVVLENIVGHVPLHLEFAGPGGRSVVVVERVVDDGAVIGVTALRIVAADGDASCVAVIDEIVAGGDVTGGAVFVFAGELDTEIDVVNDVALDHDTRAAVHVNPVGGLIFAVGRVAA